MTQESSLVELGRITAAHGLKGEVKIHSYTEDPCDIESFGTLCDASGTPRFKLKITGATGGAMLARIEGCSTREQAEALKGETLWVPRTSLPTLETGQHYHADLIGLEITLEDGTPYGRVGAIKNFGAGDLVEIIFTDNKTPELLPFTPQFFPKVELGQRRLIVSLPEYVSAKE